MGSASGGQQALAHANERISYYPSLRPASAYVYFNAVAWPLFEWEPRQSDRFTQRRREATAGHFSATVGTPQLLMTSQYALFSQYQAKKLKAGRTRLQRAPPYEITLTMHIDRPGQS